MPGLASPKEGKTIKQHRVCSTPAFIWSLHCVRFCFGSASIVGSMMALQFQPRFIVMLDHVAPCVMFWHFQGSMNWNMIAIAAIVTASKFTLGPAQSRLTQDAEDSGCQWLQKMLDQPGDTVKYGGDWHRKIAAGPFSHDLMWCPCQGCQELKEISQSASPNKKGLKRGQEQDVGLITDFFTHFVSFRIRQDMSRWFSSHSEMRQQNQRWMDSLHPLNCTPLSKTGPVFAWN